MMCYFLELIVGYIIKLALLSFFWDGVVTNGTSWFSAKYVRNRAEKKSQNNNFLFLVDEKCYCHCEPYSRKAVLFPMYMVQYKNQLDFDDIAATISSRAFSSAPGKFSGFRPPAWAKLGLPPPPPPRVWLCRRRTSLPGYPS